MPPRKGNDRLAVRLAVLNAAAANPTLGSHKLSKLLASGDPPLTVNESTIRSIWPGFRPMTLPSALLRPTKVLAGHRRFPTVEKVCTSNL